MFEITKKLYKFIGWTEGLKQINQLEAMIIQAQAEKLKAQKAKTVERKERKAERKIALKEQEQKIVQLQKAAKTAIAGKIGAIKAASTLIGVYTKEDFVFKEEVKEFCKYYDSIPEEDKIIAFMDIYSTVAQIVNRDFDTDMDTFKDVMKRQGKVAPHAPKYDWAKVDMVSSDAGYKVMMSIVMGEMKSV